jgi:hypothetical protein
MRSRIVPAILGMALAVTMTGLALAQAEDDSPPPDGATPGDSVVTAPVATSMPIDTVVAPLAVDQPSGSPASTLFLQLLDPAHQDVVVPLSMNQLMIHGFSLPEAVVSIDGDLVDIDDQGNFAGATTLDEGANEIEVVASDSQGNQTTTTLFVVRGE